MKGHMPPIISYIRDRKKSAVLEPECALTKKKKRKKDYREDALLMK